MKAVGIYSHGDFDVLVYEDAPCPHPGAGEMLIRVPAAGINPVGWKGRERQLNGTLHHAFPSCLVVMA